MTSLSIGFTSIASTIAHLFENDTHGMTGIKWLRVSKSTSHLLFHINSIGIVMVVIRLLWLLLNKHKSKSFSELKKDHVSLLSLVVSLVLHQVSDYNMYNPKYKMWYVCTHSLWHMSIFCLMDEFLKNFIY